MALALLNRAKMTVSGTPGTGTITLNAAATDFQTFAAAGIHDGARVPYLIEDGSDWEYGLGDYTASGTTLARTVILGSSNSGSAISATSAATVAVVPIGQVFPTHAGKPVPTFSTAYNISDTQIVGPSAATSINNGLWLNPFTLGSRRSFNRIGVRTGTYSSSTSIRVGIYRDSINGGVPGRLLLDAGVITAAAANTTYEITISQTLGPGLYWLASTANGTGCQWISNSSGSCMPIALNSSYASRHSLYVSHTYGALPSDITSETFSLETIANPVIHLRAA